MTVDILLMSSCSYFWLHKRELICVFFSFHLDVSKDAKL